MSGGKPRNLSREAVSFALLRGLLPSHQTKILADALAVIEKLEDPKDAPALAKAALDQFFGER